MRTLMHEARRRLASPARTTRMAVVIGRLLGLAFLVCFATGLYSHYLQEPLPWMRFPTAPVSLYRVTQGIHITAGIACVPLLLAKQTRDFHPRAHQANLGKLGGKNLLGLLDRPHIGVQSRKAQETGIDLSRRSTCS